MTPKLTVQQKRVLDALRAGKRVFSLANPLRIYRSQYAWCVSRLGGEDEAHYSVRTISVLRAQRLLTVARCEECRELFEYKLAEGANVPAR